MQQMAMQQAMMQQQMQQQSPAIDFLMKGFFGRMHGGFLKWGAHQIIHLNSIGVCNLQFDS